MKAQIDNYLCINFILKIRYRNRNRQIIMTDKQKYIWGTTRRFNALSDYFKKEFGGRVQKVSVNAGFTCPNRDGKTGKGGCTYCNNEAFSPGYCLSEKPVRIQIEEGIEFHQTRYRRSFGYLVYFQSYTNTYAGVDHLRKLYNEALSVPGVKGLVIGTRPDCIDDEILGLIAEIARDNYVIVEYGIESCYNKTLKEINRGHDFEASVSAIRKTAELGIRTGGHLIFGLPGESREEMLAEADILSALPLNTIKFHQLQIVKGTVVAAQYKEDPEKFNLFGLEDYFEFLVEFIGKLNPSFVVERFAGEVPLRFIAGGVRWGLRYDQILGLFENKLKEKDTWQGKYFNPGNV
jgi:uncharacterized protein